MGAAVEELVREGMDRLAAVAEVPPGLAGRAYAAVPRRALGGQALDAWLAVPPAVTLAVGLWGVTARPYWGDEVDTLAAVSRSLPQLARLLGHVDAVHGLYYLLLWPVVRVAGTGEFATRLPSVVAMAGAALGVSVIGRRLRSRRAGLCAGLVFAALPIVTQQAHDARPYAMATAAAVLASYLLVRAADDPRSARFAAYGLALVLLGYLELFGLLLLPAHALTMAALRRQPSEAPARLARQWLVTAAAAGAAVAPVAVWGWRQRGQIGWIGQPGWLDVTYLARWLAVGSAASAALIAALAILGARYADRSVPARPPSRVKPRYGAGWPGMRTRPPRVSEPLTWLALPWLVLPPSALMAASQIEPVYSFRYVIFCLPAVALLAGAGLAALGQLLRAVALALLMVLAAPAQLALRIPGSGAGGGLQAAAQVLAAHERPGDAVIYPGPTIPPWYLAYPRAFRPLHNIGLSHPGAAIGHLYATSVPAPVLIRRERAISGIWVIEMGPPWPNPAPYLAPGFRLIRAWQPFHDQVRLALYQRAQHGPQAQARWAAGRPRSIDQLGRNPMR
jgi:mannosyltransferase